MNDSCKAEQTQCTAGIERIAGFTSETENLLSQLEDNLSSVLKEPVPPPSMPGKTENVEEVLVPLANELNNQFNRIRDINRILQGFVDRLEN